jgi:hypothetical protein
MSEKLAIAVQFCIATGIGCWTYAWLLEDGVANPKILFFGPLIFGFGGLWLTMYLWTRLRHGKEAAKSLSMEP